MEATLKKISQILVYVSLKYAGEGVKKDLVLSMTNVYGALYESEETLYLYDSNKHYIGVIDTKCPNTVVSIVWSIEEE